MFESATVKGFLLFTEFNLKMFFLLFEYKKCVVLGTSLILYFIVDLYEQT